MSRFGDNATGPSNLEISNISGVSADINTLASYTTELGNLGPVSAQISDLGAAAVIADMSALGTQAVREDMDALADVTAQLGVLGNTTTTGYIAAIGSSTVGATSQLTVDALGQLTSEISLLASNVSTLQNSASNSPIQLANLSDVDFGGNTPSAGETIVYVEGSTNKFELQPLPGAGPLGGSNLTETTPLANQILKISSVTNSIPQYVNTDVSALVYDAGFSGVTEVAAATPADAGEVLHYDGSSAWTVGKLAYTEITGTPTDVSQLNNDAGYLTGYGASTNLSDSSELVRNNTDSTLTGDYIVDGNLDVTTGELRVSTIDPDPHGNTGTLTILGNLQVDGTTTTINSETLTINDKSVTLSKPITGNTTFSAMNGAGIDVDATNMGIIWETSVPSITYSTDSAGNTADAQTWDINRGVVAKGWSDGTNSYDGQLTINCSANTHGVTIEGPDHNGAFTDYILKLPDAAPAAGQMLVASSTYANDDKLQFVDQPAAGATVGVAAAMAIVF